MNNLPDSNAIVSSDSGTIATWTARYVEMRDDMKFSLSGSLATMANGLPPSIGAAVAYPGRQVVCVAGDGGLTMLMGEIATLVKDRFAGRARACGAVGFTIGDPQNAKSTLRQALAHPGPAVIEAVVDPNEPLLPGKLTSEQALHFAEALGTGEKDRWKIIKTVLEDKVREVI